MTKRKFQDVWKEQCKAARAVREQYGSVSALDYLVLEKLMNFAEVAVTRPEFARELPRFVGEIRSIFGTEEIRIYFEHIERVPKPDDDGMSTETNDDDMFIETPEQRAATQERLSRLRELLTSTTLGTA